MLESPAQQAELMNSLAMAGDAAQPELAIDAPDDAPGDTPEESAVQVQAATPSDTPPETESGDGPEDASQAAFT